MSSAVGFGMVLVLIYRFGKHLITDKEVQMESPIEEFIPLLAMTGLYMINLGFLVAPAALVLVIVGAVIYYNERH